MDQVAKVKRHLKQEQWKALINECQSSKMTVAAWCKVNGICDQTPQNLWKILQLSKR